MNSTQYVTPLEKQGISCRQAVLTDVAKFFILNVGLHAFTVVSRPGAGFLITMVDSVAAILVPFSGTRTAVLRLCRFGILKGTKLEVAEYSDALCMIVPVTLRFGRELSPSLTNVHGHHLIHGFGLHEWIKGHAKSPDLTLEGGSNIEEINPSDYKLVQVPTTNVVESLSIPCCKAQCNIEIASDYNSLKALAAIIQILYGSYELYSAARRSDQFNRFGYAAYSITVIPYTLMSFVNGLASLSGPSYPSMYLVYYNGYYGRDIEGKIRARPSGASEAGGSGQRGDDPTKETPGSILPVPSAGVGPDLYSRVWELSKWVWKSGERVTEATERKRYPPLEDLTEKEIELIERLQKTLVGAVGQTYGKPKSNPPPKKLQVLLFWLLLPVPYLIIFLLTGYKARQSTLAQRTWMSSSITLNVFLWRLPFSVHCLKGILKQWGRATAVPEEGTELWRRIQVWLQAPGHALLALFLFTLVMSVPTIGSFVVVAQMMLDDQICVKV